MNHKPHYLWAWVGALVLGIFINSAGVTNYSDEEYALLDDLSGVWSIEDGMEGIQTTKVALELDLLNKKGEMTISAEGMQKMDETIEFELEFSQRVGPE